jgi:hypothetical protein
MLSRTTQHKVRSMYSHEVLVLVLMMMMMMMVMMLIMFGTHSFGIAAGRRHHSHGDEVGVSVSRRIAFIRLRDCSASGLSKLHLSSDDTLQASSGVVGRRKRVGVQGMRGGLVRLVGRCGAHRSRHGKVRWEDTRAATWERMSSEEVLEYGKVGHRCAHHLSEPVVGEPGGD